MYTQTICGTSCWTGEPYAYEISGDKKADVEKRAKEIQAEMMALLDDPKDKAEKGVLCEKQ